jgi:hypothetical protein
VAFVQGLGQLQRAMRREPEPVVGLALEAGQIVEQRRKLGGGLAFLGDDAGFAEALLAEALRFLLVPDPLGFQFGIAILLAGECLIEPTARIFTRGGGERGVHLVIPGARML